MGKLLKYEKNVINCTDLCKIIALGEEHFEQSCFDISVDLRRRLMNSKDEFKHKMKRYADIGSS